MNFPEILNMSGTNKSLAKKYGVSERTIYRWKSKARKSLGIKVSRPRRPRMSTLRSYTGTRKDLASKYGVSERTIYRWLAKARNQGQLESSNRSQYPGPNILTKIGTNRDIAALYNVSTRTIYRWKAKARTELEDPFEVLPPDDYSELEEQFEVLPPDDYSELEDPFEVLPPDDYSELDEILNSMVNDLIDLHIIAPDSLFNQIPSNERSDYIDVYLKYMYGQDEHMFYDPESHSMLYDPDDMTIIRPDKVSMLDIWGEEFENWLSWQIDARDIEI